MRKRYIFEGLHRVGTGNSIWNVFEDIALFLLAINTKGEDTIFGEVHIRLLIISLLDVRVQDHLEVLPFQKILLEFFAVDQCFITIGRPGSWQDVQETCCTLAVLVDEVGHDVFEFLCLFHRKEETFAAASFILWA